MIRSRSLEKVSRKTSEFRKDGASISDHVRMASAVHRMRGKQILAAKDSFPNQRAGDAVG